jgi:hypothetical protein
MASTVDKSYRSIGPPLLLILAWLIWPACSETDTATSPVDEEVVVTEDRTPPQAVVDLAMSYPVLGGSAIMSWTAPHDEGGPDHGVDKYVVRYSYSHPLVWEQAITVADPPTPNPEGDPQSYEFAEPRRGRDLYTAVRSFDAKGNGSTVSNVAHVYIPGLVLQGRCVDALSGNELAGLHVQVTDRRVHTSETNERGRYRFEELAAGLVHLNVNRGVSEVLYHKYHYTVDLSDDVSLEQAMVEYMPTEIPVGNNVLSLLSLALEINNHKPALVKWRSFPLDVYVPAFVNTDLVDYQDICRRAVEHWNDRVGLALFRLVGEQPEKGVWFRFRPRTEMAPLLAITHHENDASGYPKTSDISIVDDLTNVDKLWVLALHELGHTFRFGHLPKGYLLYGGHPLPATVTNDEVMVTRLYLALPNGTDLTAYDSGAPE